MFSKSIYADTNSKLIPFLHYLLLASSILPALGYIIYKDNRITKRQLILITSVSAFIIINYLSRQIILLCLLSLIMAYGYYNYISILKGIFFIALIGFMFIYVGKFRISMDDPNISTTEYLHKLSQTKYKVNVIEYWAVLYSSERYYNLNSFITQANNTRFNGYGVYTLRPLLSFFFLNRIGVINYSESFDIIHNPNMSTFVIDPFLDFRYIGCIIINFIYGVIATLAFMHYWQNRKSAIVAWAICMFCIIMMPFMNYFNTFIVWFIYGINKLLFK